MHGRTATPPILLAASSLILVFSAARPTAEAQSPSPSRAPATVSGQPQTRPALPSTPPTSAPPAASNTPSDALQNHAPIPSRAEIKWFEGRLAVTADNSSLNQILHDIAQHTGMKITGGVPDERVFGNYGPAPASEVLAQLLDGTGSNVLLLQDSVIGVRELVLTPRTGAASPPNPNAYVEPPPLVTDYPPQFSREEPTHPRRSQNGVRGELNNSTPQANSELTTQQSPNGVRTPQQILDQNLERQQQNQSSPNGNPPQSNQQPQP